MRHLATDPSHGTDAVHEHGWLIESEHLTSEGRVVYVRCTDCGTRRVDIQPQPFQPPRELSIAVPRRRFSTLSPCPPPPH